MGDPREPLMTDAEVKRAVIGMLTAAIEFCTTGEMHPGLVAAVEAPTGVEGATVQVESHYRRVLFYLVDNYLNLAGAAAEAGVNPLSLLQQRALAEDDDPPLP